MGGQTIGSNLGTKTQHISNNKDNLHSTYVSSVQLLGSGTYCWIKEFEPKENRHQKTFKKIGCRDPLLVTDSHKSSGANGRTNVLCFFIRCCFKTCCIICDFGSNYDLLYATLRENVICYQRFCIKIRFSIYDFPSKCDLLYPILYQDAIYYKRFRIKT